MADKARLHVLIEGRVQGVFFRVEAVFEGDKRVVENMLAWCRKGPPYAYVDRVEVEWQAYVGDLVDFRVVY